ncbi:hypothetical protein UFOVP319_18 [uncultured Caudovirales phage]|uniref:Uncharacterized protein n=1 Tax=uncultured Caudovirales phage TaxID=2100421 RepID=A0A6J5LZR0_9CAUD|nr:hypothetical protein UFOVP319_18 [uncultured Caudovirales phage]
MMPINQDKVRKFQEANAASPVVFGSAQRVRGGVYYRLADGKRFRLTRDECAEIGCPLWSLPTS